MKSLKELSKKVTRAGREKSLPIRRKDSSLAWPQAPLFQAPVVDVSEDEKEVAVKAEVPGLSPKDLELSYSEGILYLKGEKREEKEERRKNTWHQESWEGSFSRSIPVGAEVDWAKAQAKHKNGVLTVILPKIGGKQAGKRIEIQ